jgi:metal-responsive CopG/Arc/MetJ family transcriptional regulator
MRVTQTWTISLPPAMSRLAQRIAREEHRTKSELIREALRGYLANRRHTPWGETDRRLGQMGELVDVYRQRYGRRRQTEGELREAFRPIRRFHDRVKTHSA